MTDDGISSKLTRVGSNMRVDLVTEEVVSQLSSAGLDTILLKGPTVTSWLYADDPPAYGDTDLLIDFAFRSTALEILGSLGFEPTGGLNPRKTQPPEAAFTRNDGARIDLHWGLTEISAGPELVWEVLSSHTAEFRLRGTTVNALDKPARAFHVVVHALKHGLSYTRTRTDLARLIAVLDEPTWRQAVLIARKLDAEREFAAGLRLDPHGDRIVAFLDLDVAPTLVTSARSSALPPSDRDDLVTVARFADTKGLKSKARFLFEWLFPPATVISQTYTRDGANIVVGHVRRWRAVIPRALRAIRRLRNYR